MGGGNPILCELFMVAVVSTHFIFFFFFFFSPFFYALPGLIVIVSIKSKF